MDQTQIDLTLEPTDNQRLAASCGTSDAHLKQIEQHFSVTISNRAHQFQLSGNKQDVELASQAVTQLYAQTEQLNANQTLTANDVHLTLCEISHQAQQHDELSHERKRQLTIETPRLKVAPRNSNQANYLDKINKLDINFSIGPAGTGKTFLAVAAAVQALDAGQVQRILLVRPAVEAGEALGFLPGDLSQKIDPYLRPLYDALHDMIGSSQVERLVERNTIEIAPLAYMRGRTINEAFMILDESQNSTKEQMKMCLTRLGYGSKVVVTGDTTQIDLPHNRTSGLVHAKDVLSNVPHIGFTEFESSDVVRHPLVQHIVEAYDKYDQNHHN